MTPLPLTCRETGETNTTAAVPGMARSTAAPMDPAPMDPVVERYHALDALRAGLMLLGIPYHAALPYATLDVRSFKDVSTHPAFDALVVFTLLFRMPLFFVLAGFFAGMLHARYGTAELMRNRARRILVPLLLGWIFLCPLIAMGTTFARGVRRWGSLAPALQEVTVVVPPDVGLYHLWFLAVLLLFYADALAGRRLMMTRPLGSRARTMRALPVLGSPWRSLTLAAPASLILLLPWRYDRSMLVGIVLFVLFCFGWLLHERRDELPMLGRYAWPEIGVALALFAAGFPAFRQIALRDRGPSAPEHLMIVSAAALILSLMVFGLLGLCIRYLGRARPAVRYLSDASYALYIIHFPLVVWAAALLGSASWPAGIKWLITLSIAVPVALVTYHYGIRRSPLSGLIGVASGRPAPTIR